jgi:hypothetical protein
MMQLLDQVHSGQQQLLQLWQVKRVRLDQCLQLRMFEQDCEKVKTLYSSFYIKNNFTFYFIIEYSFELQE